MLQRARNVLFPRRPTSIDKSDWDNPKWPIVTEDQVSKITRALPKGSTVESQEAMVAAARLAVRMYWHVRGYRERGQLRWSKEQSDKVEMAHDLAKQLVALLETMDGYARARFRPPRVSNTFDGTL